VEDIDTFANRLDLGEGTVDIEKRVLFVSVDPEKLANAEALTNAPRP